ncbi:hypothetical protein [Ktedonobacter robiniae]|uniref:Uncharacterized protein n=1 Tax=Ktedonobacter robiniae TaxID=2778365 RepID=A0ABQ3UU02_9CHLR|nr:hypothetical protein [Ktedonobacter robiniae]GHO55910.1 hypothetical protein KSB_43850 [Ktedonobacter robiniae]
MALLHAWYAYYQHSQILASLLARDFKAGSTSEDENGTLSGLYTALPDDLAAIQKGDFRQQLGKALSYRVVIVPVWMTQ